MLSNMTSLPETFSCCRSSDLFQRFFLLTWTLHLSFLHLNFTITDSFFFIRWQACKSSGLTSCLVRGSALQMFSSSSSSLIDVGNYKIIFIFLSCWEKAQDNKKFSRENSKPCCESRITTRSVKPWDDVEWSSKKCKS